MQPIAHSGTPVPQPHASEPVATVAPAAVPAAMPEMPPIMREPAPNPPHATTGSNLAPTSEFARYVLLALPARYTIRGLFDKGLYTNSGIGLGSTALTLSYSNMVKSDIMNLFSEAVGYETGKPHHMVTMRDVQKSDNRIVAKTLENWNNKTYSRLFTDALFFLTPLLNLFPKLRPHLHKENRIERLGDFALGVKGVQLFAETWKRQPTLFEHIAALVNSKINPKNGLGQPISVGEVFDLYQHYHFQFNPEKAFTNVFDNDTGETHVWSGGKPVFDRMAELLNLTYSYKHATRIDEKTGQPILEGNFGLPKFLYLLGHDMIDPAKPQQTLLYIEIANTHGMEAVKQAKLALDKGSSINDVLTHFPVKLDMSRTPASALAPSSSKKGTKPIADEVPPTTLPTNMLAESTTREPQGTLVTMPERLATL